LLSHSGKYAAMVTGLAIAAAFRWVRGYDYGVFGDDGSKTRKTVVLREKS